MKRRTSHHTSFAVVLLAVVVPPTLLAMIPDPADYSMRQFLQKDDTQRSYRAMRRLEAENGGRRGWLEAVTEYSIESGFHYQVTAEGGSSLVRSKVLRAVLDGEREIIAEGETARSLALANYAFQPNGVDDDGLANILLSPKREERVLVEGTMFLKPDGGDLVRLQGRLAKNPSFWVRNVQIVRSYKRIEGVVVPVTLESTARARPRPRLIAHDLRVFRDRRSPHQCCSAALIDSPLTVRTRPPRHFGRVVGGEECLDPQLLQCHVFRRAESHDCAEKTQLDLVPPNVNGQEQIARAE